METQQKIEGTSQPPPDFGGFNISNGMTSMNPR